MATNETEKELAECISNIPRGLLDIDDNFASLSSDCHYENYEEFANSVDIAYFEQDFRGFLSELMETTQSVLSSREMCDIRNVFEESGIPIIKFNLFLWYFLENGKRPESREGEVRNAVNAACSYIGMCAINGARFDFYQIGLYNLCLKITRNCCHTIRIGDTTPRRSSDLNESRITVASALEALIGPPRISVDRAKRHLNKLTTQLFAFLHSNNFSLDEEIQMETIELIEEIGRVELENKITPRTIRVNSIGAFEALDKFVDRYCAFVDVLIDSRYPTRREMAYKRLIRPRLAMIPYPDEGKRISKINTARRRAGELTAHLIVSRIERNPDQRELELIETVLVMVYSQCPNLAEFRQNISQFIYKILQKLPYEYAYDFVHSMNVLFKGGSSSGVRSLSNDLASLLLIGFDFSAPDPGVPQEVESSESSEGSEFLPTESERRKSEEKQKQKRNSREGGKRIDAITVFFNIIYKSCIDKNAAMRLHGSVSFKHILESPAHRIAFQNFCRKENWKMDRKFGGIGSDRNESMNTTARTTPRSKKRKPSDILQDGQEILNKFQRLQRMNRGEQRVEKDTIYMLIRQLASDEKSPIKKNACPLIKSFILICEDEIKFEMGLSMLQKLCRDRVVSVRKTAAEAFTELMISENILFKKSLSSKWLHSLISMLNDTDNEVIEHATKLIMKALSPHLEHPSDLSWTLFDTIESVTNHRNYMMGLLKDPNISNFVNTIIVMENMRNRIDEGEEGSRGAWMIFSQLCVQFKTNLYYPIELFQRVDLSTESNLVKYMIHIIENNIERIDIDIKSDLILSLRSTFRDFCLHSSHARCLYYFLGKLMNGIGDNAENKREFEEFGQELLVSSFDTIVQSFEMFKDKEEWKRNAESQERLLCTALNASIEVFSYCPSLIPRHERLAKTLSLIVNSNDSSENDTINPDVPSAHPSRPQTRMADFNSQRPYSGMVRYEGIMFSEKVRATSVITLGNMILTDNRLLKLMPTLVKQLKYNPSHHIRSNTVVSIGDICSSYKTDRYAPVLAASLCDPSVIVRRHAINQIARLISLGIARFNGEIMIRMMLATLDANKDVRNDAKLYISEVMKTKEPDFLPKNFVEYMISLTQSKRIIRNEEEGRVDVSIGGGEPLQRSSRIAIYTFMIESLTDRHRFDVKQSIGQRIFTPIVNGEYDFEEDSTQCLLEDALLIMASSEMQVKMEIGKNPNKEALEEPSPEAVMAANGLIKDVYFEHYMMTIVPSILALREFLTQKRSNLQRKCLLAIRMICLEFNEEIDKILVNHRQLKDEINFELNRVRQRNEEANRILDEAIKRVEEFNRRRRISEVPETEEPPEEEPEPNESVHPVEDVNMTVSKRTPAHRSHSEQVSSSIPQSRLLSSSEMRQIRRSVGALIRNEMTLNQPNLEETISREMEGEDSRRHDVEEEEGMEDDVFEMEEGIMQKSSANREEREESTSFSRRSSRRKRSNHIEAETIEEETERSEDSASESAPGTSQKVPKQNQKKRKSSGESSGKKIRLCSTPKRKRDGSSSSVDVTFAADISAITEDE